MSLVKALWFVGLLMLLPTTRISAQWTTTVPHASTAPAVDGRFSLGEWDGATKIEDFRQIEPVEGGPPSEKTICYLMADADHLFIGLRCFDSDPSGIRATLQYFDADLDPDDRVEIVIDTFLDRRNAYFFQIGAGGSKGDALIASSGQFFVKDWDGIWEGRAAVDESGWTAELAIPAKTLTMHSSHEAFGFNLNRVIKRKNETIQWANPSRSQRMFAISNAGTLEGLSVLDQGLGLDLRPYIAAILRRNHRAGEDELELQPGFDARYRLTPGLAATLTVNTDFAETEVDDRVVNLDRFPVFFPEKRDFFLEDAGIFSFGGLGGSRGTSGDPVPFFSRRIGIGPNGQEIPILVGAKLTGRVGDWGLGFLDAVMDSSDGVDSKNLAVARVTRNVFEESTVGALFTYGDPRTNGDNGLFGLDFTYRTRQFLENQVLRLDAFALGTFDSPDENASESEDLGYAYGLKATYPNDTLRIELAYRELGENFRPDLGFAPRTGVRRTLGLVEYRPRIGAGIRRFEFRLRPDAFFSLEDGRVETFQTEIQFFGLELESEDSFGMGLRPTVERLRSPFEIQDDVLLPPGEYDFTPFFVSFETSNGRPVSFDTSFESGGFYSGSRTIYEAGITLTPSDSWSVRLGYERNEVHLPEGDFDTNLASLRLGIDFSPEVSWRTTLQYDDVSDTLGVNSRLRWILEPGSDLFVVINQGYLTRDEFDDRFALSIERSDFTLKLGITFRF